MIRAEDMTDQIFSGHCSIPRGR